jgi:hypothetical protein
MEYLLILLTWSIIVIAIFIFIPNEKIKSIGDFFNKVLPKLPISEIIKGLRK